MGTEARWWRSTGAWLCHLLAPPTQPHHEQRRLVNSANHLIDAITSRPEFKQGLEAGPKGLDRLQEAMRMGSLALDAEMRSLPAIKSNEDHSGTTAVFALVTPTHLIVGNIGDSRCVMSRAGKAVAMSYDHKPTNPPEQARIEAANGTVTLSRVNGDLAVSRALGDYSYKQMAHLPAEAQQVSAEPEFQVQERTSDDQFLILCCDGIWDVMTNDDVVSFYIQKEQGGGNLKQSCGDLLDSCLDRKSRDNMTTLGVRLGGKL